MTLRKTPGTSLRRGGGKADSHVDIAPLTTKLTPVTALTQTPGSVLNGLATRLGKWKLVIGPLRNSATAPCTMMCSVNLGNAGRIEELLAEIYH